MYTLVVQLLLYVTLTLAVPPTVVHKCCPDKFVMSFDHHEGVHRCVQHEARTSAWHPRIGSAQFETAVPGTLKESLAGVRQRCAYHNWIATDLTGGEVIKPDQNGELQMIISHNTVNYFGPETCFDQLLEEGGAHPVTSLVSINCPCYRQLCVYLCCGEAEHEIDLERQNSFENQKCGYTEAEWRGSLQRVLPDSAKMNVLETESPAAMCLQETLPYYRIEHPDIVAVTDFRVDAEGSLVTSKVRKPSAQFCLGLTKSPDKSLNVTAYYCSDGKPQGVKPRFGSTPDYPDASLKETSNTGTGYPNYGNPDNGYPNSGNPNSGYPNGGNPNSGSPNSGYLNQDMRWYGPSHAWLAGLGAVLTVITLVRVVLSPKLREGAQGICLVGFCFIMLMAYICIAYLPTAVKSDTFKDTSSKSCVTLAILIQYSLISAFTWLNERTVLIQGEFRTWKSKQVWLGTGKNQVWWKLLLLCLLCLGVAAIAPIINAVQRKFVVTPENPNLLNKTLCWFITWQDYILLYALPMILAHFFNMFYIVANVFQLWGSPKVATGATPPTQEDIAADKMTFRRHMLVELTFTALWLSEVVCFAFNHYWYSLSGVLVVRTVCVFAIFCCPSETWGAIKSTLCPCCMTEGALELSDQAKKKKQNAKNGENPFEDPGMPMETYDKSNTM